MTSEIEETHAVPLKYVAFCDVLGFSQAVENDFDATISLYKRYQIRLNDWPFPEKVDVSVYSDSILLVCDELAPLLYAVQSLWFATLPNDWLIRGAITYGKYWEDKSNGNLFVVSDALVRAVHLESAIKHPCVVLSPEIDIPLHIWLARFEQGLFGMPLLHYDGLNVVNPFNRFWFMSARNRVEQMKSKWPEHSSKYDWFLGLATEVENEELLTPASAIEELLERGIIGLKNDDSICS